MYSKVPKQSTFDDHSIWICFDSHDIFINIEITIKCLIFANQMITFISCLILFYQYSSERLDLSWVAKLAKLSTHHLFSSDSCPGFSVFHAMSPEVVLVRDLNKWVYNYICHCLMYICIIIIVIFEWLLGISSCLSEGLPKSNPLPLSLGSAGKCPVGLTWAHFKLMLP